MSRATRVLLLAALAATFAAVVLAPGASAGERSARPPLEIKGDAMLAGTLPGIGNKDHPYRLSGCEIAATGATGIYIEKTTKWILIEDCRVANGGATFDGIVLNEVRNVVVRNVLLENNRVGITISKSTDVEVRGSSVNSTAKGILLDGSSRVTLRDNAFPQNPRGVEFADARANKLERNVVTLAHDQVAFWFDDKSLNNSIPTSNVVNGVPMRWYTAVRGATIDGAVVTLPGMTNLAQVLLWDSHNVTLRAPVGSRGTGTGILVVKSRDVRLEEPTAEANAGAGIRVSASARVRVEGANSAVNAGDGVRFDREWGVPTDSRGNRLENSTVVGNRGRGVYVDELHRGLRLHADVVRDSGAEGILLAKGSRWTNVSHTSVVNSTGSGLRVVEGVDGLFVRDSAFERNFAHGVRIESGFDRLRVERNRLAENGESGLSFHRVAPARLDARPGQAEPVVAANAFTANGLGGLAFTQSFEASVRGNSFEDEERSIRLANSSRSTFHANRVLLGGTGIWFDDEFSYDNHFSVNNTVDGTPVHWQTRIHGTPKKPIRYDDVRVELANVTNVAQILLHNSSHVEYVRPVVANGTRTGIYLHQSSDVVVRRLRAEANERSGVEIASLEKTDPVAFAGGNLIVEPLVLSNGAAGIEVRGVGAFDNVVRRAHVASNGDAGVLFVSTGARNAFFDGVVQGNAGSGVRFQNAALATLRGNVIENHTRVVEFVGSTANLLERNVLRIDPGSTGLWFADELSYSNVVRTNNTVNDVPVQWHTFLNEHGPTEMRLSGVRVGLPNITNVAQVMLYKSNRVVLEGAHVGEGHSRCVYVYSSTAVRVENGTFEGCPTGVELALTRTSTVQDTLSVDADVGIHLRASTENVVVRNAFVRAGVGVRLASDATSNRVFATDASGAINASVEDLTFAAGPPATGRNLVVDAGLDRRVEGPVPIEFTARAYSPFPAEPVVAQAWTFGDGAGNATEGGGTFAPPYAYGAPGTYRARVVVTTSAGTYDDDVLVEVSASPDAPLDVACPEFLSNATLNASVEVVCEITLRSGFPANRTIEFLVEGELVDALDLALVPGLPTEVSFPFVPTAPGRHFLRVQEAIVVVEVPGGEDGNAVPEDEDESPGPAWVGVLAAFALAARRLPRRRRSTSSP